MSEEIELFKSAIRELKKAADEIEEHVLNGEVYRKDGGDIEEGCADAVYRIKCELEDLFYY